MVESRLDPEPIGHVATLVQGLLVPWMLTELSAAVARASDDAAKLLPYGMPGSELRGRPTRR